MALANLGELASAQKDYPQARTFFQAAEEINLMDPDEWTSLILSNNLADVAIATGDLQAAVRNAQAALEMAEAQQSPHQIGLALFHLSRIWQLRWPDAAESLLAAVSAGDEVEKDLRERAASLLGARVEVLSLEAAARLAHDLLKASANQ